MTKVETIEWDGTWPIPDNARRETLTPGKRTDDGRIYTVIDIHGDEHHVSRVYIEQTSLGPVRTLGDVDGRNPSAYYVGVVDRTAPHAGDPEYYADVLASKLDNWKTEGQGWEQLGKQLGFDGSDDYDLARWLQKIGL